MKRRGRIPIAPAEPPTAPRATCADCRLHAAKIGPVAAARYQPPLGTKFRVKLKTGGTMDICPHCRKPLLRNGKPMSLAEAGIIYQRQAKKLVVDL